LVSFKQAQIPGSGSFIKLRMSRLIRFLHSRVGSWSGGAAEDWGATSAALVVPGLCGASEMPVLEGSQGTIFTFGLLGLGLAGADVVLSDVHKSASFTFAIWLLDSSSNDVGAAGAVAGLLTDDSVESVEHCGIWFGSDSGLLTDDSADSVDPLGIVQIKNQTFISSFSSTVNAIFAFCHERGTDTGEQHQSYGLGYLAAWSGGHSNGMG
jgi:hypothetical protein